MKIYTKTGDKGTTSLYDGSRVGKDELIMDVLGEMDELSSRIGMVCGLCCWSTSMLNRHTEHESNKVAFLRKIQGNIQTINSVIATPGKGKNVPSLNDKAVTQLEAHIDEMEDDLPRLTRFILPGCSDLDAQTQLCRTQARKAERMLCKLNEDRIPPLVFQYMNRLSDFFFVLARWFNHSRGLNDCFM